MKRSLATTVLHWYSRCTSASSWAINGWLSIQNLSEMFRNCRVPSTWRQLSFIVSLRLRIFCIQISHKRRLKHRFRCCIPKFTLLKFQVYEQLELLRKLRSCSSDRVLILRILCLTFRSLPFEGMSALWGLLINHFADVADCKLRARLFFLSAFVTLRLVRVIISSLWMWMWMCKLLVSYKGNYILLLFDLCVVSKKSVDCARHPCIWINVPAMPAPLAQHRAALNWIFPFWKWGCN